MLAEKKPYFAPEIVICRIDTARTAIENNESVLTTAITTPRNPLCIILLAMFLSEWDWRSRHIRPRIEYPTWKIQLKTILANKPSDNGKNLEFFKAYLSKKMIT